MKCKCVVGKIRNISLLVDEYLTKKINKEKIPILKNHISLFYILPSNSDSILFNELSKEWGISKSSLSDIVNKYHKLGFVDKCSCSDDKRSVYLSLTKEGVEMKEILVRYESEFLELFYKDFDSNERDDFENKIDRVLDNSSSI